MKRSIFIVSLFVVSAICLIVPPNSIAGVDLFEWGENVDYFKKRTGDRRFQADSLWLGATFFRDTTKPFVVWLHDNEAGCTGALHLMYEGEEKFLFYNRNNGGNPTKLDLTNLYKIPHGDTVYFMYKTIDNRSMCDGLERYTGQNRKEGEPQWMEYDPYASEAIGTENLDGQSYAANRRWAVAGWLPNASG